MPDYACKVAWILLVNRLVFLLTKMNIRSCKFVKEHVYSIAICITYFQYAFSLSYINKTFCLAKY